VGLDRTADDDSLHAAPAAAIVRTSSRARAHTALDGVHTPIHQVLEAVRRRVHDASGPARHMPACVTEKVWPPIEIVPDRGVPLRFGVTVNATVPFPLPLAPEMMSIQGALREAVHEQPPALETSMVPAPPTAVND
jgi:hypothetical protein